MKMTKMSSSMNSGEARIEQIFDMDVDFCKKMHRNILKGILKRKGVKADGNNMVLAQRVAESTELSELRQEELKHCCMVHGIRVWNQSNTEMISMLTPLLASQGVLSGRSNPGTSAGADSLDALRQPPQGEDDLNAIMSSISFEENYPINTEIESLENQLRLLNEELEKSAFRNMILMEQYENGEKEIEDLKLSIEEAKRRLTGARITSGELNKQIQELEGAASLASLRTPPPRPKQRGSRGSTSQQPRARGSTSRQPRT